TSGGSDSVMADKVNPFSVGLAVLDSEAGSMSKNMIVVGGPCANTVAAELMGNPENCAEGFEAGKAMLKYFDRSGMAALLVAGDQADDTVGAAYVLADYDSYDLSGDEVEVVVTSLDEITVS
ncbi:S-layer protein, partial [archaeon]|nr:S-layer protein [archaeon]MBT4460983.1 S-layer protein [archaeon]MBT5424124.1 S-layer protein [archaeon]MBT7440197.1 S-layer protein [archaeon]